MPVYYQGKRVPWIIPGIKPEESINLDPASFSPDMLPKGRLLLGNDTYVRIPRIPGRISLRKDGYVELILEKYYDKEARQSRNRKVIIGIDNGVLPGLMVTNDNYFNYFDARGNLVEAVKKIPEADPVPAKKDEAPADAEAQDDGSTLADADNPIQLNVPTNEAEETTTPKQTESPMNAREDTLDLREARLRLREIQMDAREKELDEREEELAVAEDQLYIKAGEAERDHIKLLSFILDSYRETIGIQARKKPDQPMTPGQIRTINELLTEFQTFFRGSDTEDYLHLAEEGNPETDTPATTNGEMSLLLSVYGHTANAYLYGGLRKKQKT